MKKKGNILVIVILVLFLSSLSGLLVTKYVSNMLNYSSEFYKYYKSFYFAKAGIELELTKDKFHGVGFEDKITTGSLTNSRNFKNCNGVCNFSSNIKSLSNIVAKDSFNTTSCNVGISYNINNGNGIILPLFYDKNIGEGELTGTNYQKISNSQFRNININLYNSANGYHSISVPQTNSVYENQRSSANFTINLSDPTFNNFYNSSQNKTYMIVANSENSSFTEQFCIDSPLIKIPTTYINVESIGRFRDRYVSLNAKKQVKLPEYLIYNIINN